VSRLAGIDPRKPPWRWLFRLPLQLYRARLGWLLGARFLALTTRGRKSGAPRSVVLEVLAREPATGGYVVASGWGPRAQWARNVEAFPFADVRVGRRRFRARVEKLSRADATEQLAAYAQRHRLAYRLVIGPLLLGRRPRGTADELAELARAMPLFALRPPEAAPPSGEAGR
jgi:deazaflavin-dependent oxidoreductase (nitroreductase family)